MPVPGIDHETSRVYGEFAQRTRVHRTGNSGLFAEPDHEPEPYWVWQLGEGDGRPSPSR